MLKARKYSFKFWSKKISPSQKTGFAFYTYSFNVSSQVVLIQNDAPWVFEQIETNSAHMLLQQFLSISVPPLPSGRVVMIFFREMASRQNNRFHGSFFNAMHCNGQLKSQAYGLIFSPQFSPYTRDVIILENYRIVITARAQIVQEQNCC